MRIKLTDLTDHERIHLKHLFTPEITGDKLIKEYGGKNKFLEELRELARRFHIQRENKGVKKLVLSLGHTTAEIPLENPGTASPKQIRSVFRKALEAAGLTEQEITDLKNYNPPLEMTISFTRVTETVTATFSLPPKPADAIKVIQEAIIPKNEVVKVRVEDPSKLYKGDSLKDKKRLTLPTEDKVSLKKGEQKPKTDDIQEITSKYYSAREHLLWALSNLHADVKKGKPASIQRGLHDLVKIVEATQRHIQNKTGWLPADKTHDMLSDIGTLHNSPFPAQLQFVAEGNRGKKTKDAVKRDFAKEEKLREVITKNGPSLIGLIEKVYQDINKTVTFIELGKLQQGDDDLLSVINNSIYFCAQKQMSDYFDRRKAGNVNKQQTK